MVTHGANSGTTVIRVPKASGWQPATVVSIREETPRVKTIRFAVSNWPGHLAGQHADVRLEAADGYRAERSYSIASPPEVPALLKDLGGVADSFVCGSANFVEVASALLLQAGQPPDGIRTERFGPTG